MSLVPMLFSNWWEELDYPHSLFDQHFGTAVDPEDIVNVFEPSRNDLLLYRPYRHRGRYHPFLHSISIRKHHRTGSSIIQPDKNKFTATLDVQQFAPEEIMVKVVDRNIVIEGKHEDRQDEHGFISRYFARKYIIPEQCDAEMVESSLSSDGIITVTCPRKESFKGDTAERQVKIQYTGRPAITDYERPNIDFVDAQRDQRDQIQQRLQPQYTLQQQQQRKKGNIKIT